MGKKKPTKVVQKQWANVSQVIVMGDEVLKEDMVGNEVYSVLMFSKGVGKLNYTWGIVITNKEGVIVRNYNINVADNWDANAVRLRGGWRVFAADSLSRNFATAYASNLSLHKNNSMLCGKVEELREYINKHWWRRV